MGDNFFSSLLVLGGLGLAVHFEQLTNQVDGVPLIMAYGSPISGKSTAVEIAMALIGKFDKIGDCTFAGAIQILAEQSLPFWWDDADKFPVLEQLAVAVFNKSNKKTSKTKAGSRTTPRTVPLITMNPTALSRTVKSNMEKMSRTFSRVVVVPFNKLPKRKGAVMTSIEIQANLKDALPNLLKSVGVTIELHEEFKNFRKDQLFCKAVETIEEVQEMDVRAQCNYSLLLYSAFKIMQKIGMQDDEIQKAKDWMKKVVLPGHLTLLGTSKCTGEAVPMDVRRFSDVEKLVVDVVKQVTANPGKGREFFNPLFLARKCCCGKVFGFNVPKALAFVGSDGMDEALRSYVRERGIGCNGVKLNCAGKQFVGTHIQSKVLPKPLCDEMLKAFNVRTAKQVKHAEEASVKPATHSGNRAYESSDVPSDDGKVSLDASDVLLNDVDLGIAGVLVPPFEASDVSHFDDPVSTVELSPVPLDESNVLPLDTGEVSGPSTYSEQSLARTHRTDNQSEATQQDNSPTVEGSSPSTSTEQFLEKTDSTDTQGEAAQQEYPATDEISRTSTAIEQSFEITHSTDTQRSNVKVPRTRRRKRLENKLQDSLSTYFQPADERAKKRKV